MKDVTNSYREIQMKRKAEQLAKGTACSTIQ